jgi:hypothetical protein
VVEAILGTFTFVCAIIVALIYATKWRLQIKDLFTGGHEAEEFMPVIPKQLRIEVTERDHELVANGWHPDDVIAARRNGIVLPDRPPERGP